MHLAPVGLVAIQLALVAMQQLRQLTDVRLRRIGRHQAMDQAIAVGAYVRLHAEVPVLALHRLAHLGVPRLCLVLGRRRRLDDRRIDDRPGLQQQPLLLQQPADEGKDLLRQPVPLRKVPEPQDRRLVRDRIIDQLDPGKTSHRLRVVQRILGCRIRQVEPLLHEVDPQHPLHRQRLRAVAGLRVVRLDQRQDPGPGNDRVHLGQKPFPTGYLALAVPGRRRKRRLLHANPQSLTVSGLCLQYRSVRTTCAELP